VSDAFTVRRTVIPHGFPTTVLLPARAWTRVPAFNTPGQGSAGQQATLRRILMTAVTGINSANQYTTGYTATPLTDTWTDSTIQIGALRKGAGWETYKSKLVAEGYASGIAETATHITFSGTAAKRFMSFFHEVITIHGLPPLVMQSISNMGTVGTKFRLWISSDRVATGPLYSAYAEPFRALAVNDPELFLVGSPRTIAGVCNLSTLVDPEELHAWPGGIVRCLASQSPQPGDTSGHGWFLDLVNGAYANALSELALIRFNSYWGAIPNVLSGYHSDNLGTQFIAGEATNEPAISGAAWTAGCNYVGQKMEIAMQGQGLAYPFSGNVGDQSRAVAMSSIKNQYWEHPFLKGDGSGYWDISSTIAIMGQTAALGASIMFGGRRLDSFPNIPIVQFEDADHSDLRAIADRAEQLGWLGKTALVFNATGGLTDSTGYLYHGPTMPPLQ